jgi:hypothetical protein
MCPVSIEFSLVVPSTMAGWPLTFYSGLRHITAAATTLRMTTPNAVDTVVCIQPQAIWSQKDNRKTNIEKRRTGSENGEEDGITDFSLAPPLTMELASKSVTGEFIKGREVIGARWTIDSEVSRRCTSLPASF